MLILYCVQKHTYRHIVIREIQILFQLFIPGFFVDEMSPVSTYSLTQSLYDHILGLGVDEPEFK